MGYIPEGALEQSVAKHGISNHVYHQNELLPNLVQQISLIPKSSFGSYKLPKHAFKEFLDSDSKPIVWSHIFGAPNHSYNISLFMELNAQDCE